MGTLKILNPEWQGFGEHNLSFSGARALARACFSRGDYLEIPVAQDEDLSLDRGILGRDSILTNGRQVRDRLDLHAPEQIFHIGGTCGSDLLPLAWMNHRYQGDLTVLWLDAHGDSNTPETSPSGHFHGMVLRCLMGEGDAALTEMVPRSLVPSQVVMAGIRELDGAESEWLTENRIKVFSPSEILGDHGAMAALAGAKSRNLYIHLDLDFFEPDGARGQQFPTPGGMDMEEAGPIFQWLAARFSLKGLSVMEWVSTDSRAAQAVAHLLTPFTKALD
ncbi:MAG: arginase family protein [Desulfobacterales bacterium]|nr:arginase family protein [Desulfobacterales bacterium]